MKKIKVLIVITKTNWGGAQRYVCDLATSLPRDIFDISVAGGGRGEKGVGSGLLAKRLETKNIPFIFLPHFTRDIFFFNEFFAFFELYRLFRNERPDIVHLNSSKMGALGSLAARLAGINKIIFTAHGFAFDEDRPFFQKIIIKFISYLTVLFSTNTIIILREDKKRIGKWPFIGSGKIHLIYNGIKPVNFLPREGVQDAIIGKNEAEKNRGKLWIGSIGELHPNKGFEYAIEAFKNIKVDDVLFVIIGSGQEKDYLKNLIKKNNLEGKVFLAGYHVNAAMFLKAFDIFIIPSIKEGFPYSLLEAGSASLPVIATDVGGISEIIEDKKSGILVQSKNIEEISKGLNFLITQKEERERFGRALHEKVLSSFSLDEEIGKVKELYKK